MQFQSNDVYKKVAKDSGLDEEFLKTLGNAVQKKLSEELRNPRGLITSLKGVGRWFLRKKRMEVSVEKLSTYEAEDPETMKLFIDRLKARLDDYVIFLEKKQETKLRKAKYKESQDNLEEHSGSSTSL